MPRKKKEEAVETVRARRFELVDEKDNTRATLGMRDGAPALVFHDKKGKERVVIGLLFPKEEKRGDGAGPILSLRDESGATRVQLGLSSKTGNAGLWLGNGRSFQACMYVEPGGVSNLRGQLVRNDVQAHGARTGKAVRKLLGLD